MPLRPTLHYFVSLLVEGLLSGAIYAVIALALVVVYKASRTLNFALGEWVTVGAALLATGLNGAAFQWLGLGLGGAIGLALGVMLVGAALFARVVLRRLVGRPLIAVVMVTLGLGALLRGSADLAFRGISRTVELPFPSGTLNFLDVPIAAGKVVAALVAVLTIAAVALFYRCSRTGIALRAIADDQQAAMVAGIDIDRHMALIWALSGALAVLAGLLWLYLAGGGFGLLLLGLKVFPIVVIGGLDSIPGTILAAMLIGLLEAFGSGYLDPLLGSGAGSLIPNLALIAMLWVRPFGLLGSATVQRV